MMAIVGHVRTQRARAGFTLMELLIVVAIIGILTSVAIPTFAGQLDQAKRAADEANARTAYACAETQYQIDGRPSDAIYAFDAASGAAVNVMQNPAAMLAISGYGQWGNAADYDVAGHQVYGTANNGIAGNYVSVVYHAGSLSSIRWDDGGVYAETVPQSLTTATAEQRKAFDDLVLQTLANKLAKMSVTEVSELVGEDITTTPAGWWGGNRYSDKNGATLATVDIWNNSKTGKMESRVYGKGASLFSDMGYITDVGKGDYRTGTLSENGELPFYSVGTGNNMAVTARFTWDGDDITSVEVWLSDYGRYKGGVASVNRDNYNAKSSN